MPLEGLETPINDGLHPLWEDANLQPDRSLTLNRYSAILNEPAWVPKFTEISAVYLNQSQITAPAVQSRRGT